jgi:hypothetical protein
MMIQMKTESLGYLKPAGWVLRRLLADGMIDATDARTVLLATGSTKVCLTKMAFLLESL